MPDDVTADAIVDALPPLSWGAEPAKAGRAPLPPAGAVTLPAPPTFDPLRDGLPLTTVRVYLRAGSRPSELPTPLFGRFDLLTHDHAGTCPVTAQTRDMWVHPQQRCAVP